MEKEQRKAGQSRVGLFWEGRKGKGREGWGRKWKGREGESEAGLGREGWGREGLGWAVRKSGVWKECNVKLWPENGSNLVVWISSPRFL